MTKGLFDNDFVLHASDCDLIDQVCAIYGVTERHVLPALRHQLKPGRSGRLAKAFQGFPVESQARVFTFLETTMPIGAPADIQFLSDCVPIQRIDDGEAMLLEAALRMPDSLIFTGDKRCLGAIAETEWLRSRLTPLQGRIALLDQAILRVIDEHGFPLVQARCEQARERRGDFQIAFGAGAHGTEARTREALGYSANEVASRLGWPLA